MRGLRILVAAACLAAIATTPLAGAAGTWKTTLAVGGQQTSIEDVEAVSNGDVWAVGGFATKTTYDAPTAWRRRGGTWTRMPIPTDLTGRWGYLTSVSVLGADNVWAAGVLVNQQNGRGSPLVAHWNGKAWSVVNQSWVGDNVTGGFTSIFAWSAGDIWVGGGDDSLGNPRAVLWHFNGFTWTRVQVPIHNGKCDVNATSAVRDIVASDDVYVALSCETNGLNTGTVERLNRGHWTSVLKLTPGNQVFGLGSPQVGGIIWAVGSTYDGRTHAAAWSGGLDGLAPVTLPAADDSWLYAVSFGPGDLVHLVGEHAQFGPNPLLISGTPDNLQLDCVPYDRGLNATTVDTHDRLLVAGPTFGGWLGGTKPHATILSRAGG